MTSCTRVLSFAAGATSALLLACSNRSRSAPPPPAPPPPTPMPMTVVSYMRPSHATQALQDGLLVIVTYALLVLFYSYNYGVPAPHSWAVEIVSNATTRIMQALVSHVPALPTKQAFEARFADTKMALRDVALRLASSLDDDGPGTGSEDVRGGNNEVDGEAVEDYDLL
ncbi:hypothetical protein AC578_1493 [Pseudocercospora eumusae]|uniref:Uncharacterized protein n=1 Tax=Pseudocercospora eumusae TaxID=321146 RepID=A0A139H5G9_9PEZI|nr:hypothetical protein AC578_1493 [Pseudocercospora eumusae]